jgi:CRP-like cAMP-binding protein
MNNPPVLAALQGSRLAADLTADELAKLAAVVTLRALRQGEVLVSEGTSDNHLYVVVSGLLSVVRGAGTPEALTLFTLSPGDFVGELSFIDDTPHYASVIASADSTTVFGLEREKLEALLDVNPRIVYHVMRAIVRVVHQIQRRLSMQQTELMNYIYKQHGRY